MIALASDHAGFALKEKLKNHLKENGYEYLDLGTDSEQSCHYPVFAKKLCEKIIKKLGDLFYDVADYDDDGELVVGNGDAQLDAIKERLVDALVHDMEYDAHTHSTEDVESFCIALVACGVSRCIVLVKPEREEG